MRRLILRASVLLLSVVMLSACGTVKKWFGKSDKPPEPDEPAALVNIENPITIEQIWGASLGAGEGDLWNRQAPVLAEGRIYASKSEEHTSELQSLMRISYAVFCLKKKKTK